MTPIWRTRIVATRARTGSVIRLLFMGIGREGLRELERIKANGFQVNVFKPYQIIGRARSDELLDT